jgi:hypothetical protein
MSEYIIITHYGMNFLGMWYTSLNVFTELNEKEQSIRNLQSSQFAK